MDLWVTCFPREDAKVHDGFDFLGFTVKCGRYRYFPVSLGSSLGMARRVSRRVQRKSAAAWMSSCYPAGYPLADPEMPTRTIVGNLGVIKLREGPAVVRVRSCWARATRPPAFL